MVTGKGLDPGEIQRAAIDHQVPPLSDDEGETVSPANEGSIAIDDAKPVEQKRTCIGVFPRNEPSKESSVETHKRRPDHISLHREQGEVTTACRTARPAAELVTQPCPDFPAEPVHPFPKPIV